MEPSTNDEIQRSHQTENVTIIIKIKIKKERKCNHGCRLACGHRVYVTKEIPLLLKAWVYTKKDDYTS